MLLVTLSCTGQAALNPKLLDDPAQAGDADMGTFGESLEDNSMESTQNELVVGSLHAEVDSVLQRLSSREAGILRMRYGLDDGQPKTLEDIGYAFNVSLGHHSYPSLSAVLQ